MKNNFKFKFGPTVLTAIFLPLAASSVSAKSPGPREAVDRAMLTKEVIEASGEIISVLSEIAPMYKACKHVKAYLTARKVDENYHGSATQSQRTLAEDHWNCCGQRVSGDALRAIMPLLSRWGNPIPSFGKARTRGLELADRVGTFVVDQNTKPLYDQMAAIGKANGQAFKAACYPIATFHSIIDYSTVK